MSSLSSQLLPEALRSRGFATIGVAYMGIGTALNNETRLLYILNLTNGKLMFSFDGVNDHFPLVPAAFLLLDVCANKSLNDFEIEAYERIYVKYLSPLETPSVGTVYVAAFYGKENPNM